MSRSRLVRSLALSAAVALACTTLASCSGNGGSAGVEGGAIAKALRAVPSSTTGYVWVTRWDAIRTASPYEPKGDTTADKAWDTLTHYSNGTTVAPAPTEFFRPPDLPFGIRPDLVDTEVSAGTAPNGLVAVAGGIDTDDVLTAASDVDGATSTSFAGAKGVSWLADNQVEAAADPPFGALPQAFRVAEVDDGIAIAHNDATIDASVKAAGGNHAWLSDDDAAVLVSTLDEHDVYAAALTVDASNPVLAATGRYPGATGFAIGVRRAGDASEIVVVVTSASAQVGTENAKRLAGAVSGESARTGENWSRWLGTVETDASGSTAVATVTTTRPQLWWQMVQQQDGFAATTS